MREKIVITRRDFIKWVGSALAVFALPKLVAEPEAIVSKDDLITMYTARRAGLADNLGITVAGDVEFCQRKILYNKDNTTLSMSLCIRYINAVSIGINREIIEDADFRSK